MTLPDPDPKTPAEAAALRRAPWWWRALARMGVISVWGAGLLVSVAALALVGVLWLSRQPAGHLLTFALTNRALAHSTNLRLSARRSLLIAHGAYLVEPVVELVDSAGVRRPFLVAARARLVSTWWGLLMRNPEAVRVELVDPVITITRRPGGGYILPAFRPGPKTERAPNPLTIDLGLENALVRVVGAGAPPDTIARALDLTGRAHGAGGTWDFALGRLASVLPGAGLAITKGDGRLRLSDGQLALDHLRVRTDAGWIEADGSGAISPTLDLEGRVSVGEWTWHDLASIFRQKALDLPGGFSGKSRVHVTRTSVAILGADADVLWRDEPAVARFDGVFEGGRVAVTNAHVAWRKSAFAGAFSAEPAARRWRLVGALENLQLAELPRLWPMPAQGPARISADVDLTGTPRGLEARVARGRGAWQDLPFDSLGGTWAMAGTRQTIDVHARAAGGSLAARGTIEPNRLAAVVHALGVEAARVPAAWWRGLGLGASPEGRLVALDATLDGPPSRPTARGTALVSGVSHQGLEVSRAALTFDGPLGADYAVAITARVGDSRIGFASADSAEAEVAVTPRRIDLPRFHAVRAESTVTLSGSATRSPGGWEARVDHLAWDAGERIHLDNDGPIEFLLAPGGAIDVHRARVVSSAGALSAKGRWGGARGTNDLALDLETLDLESLLGPLAARYEVRGVLTGHARFEGAARHATWTVDLDGRDLQYRAYSARRVVARGRFADESWSVEKLAVDTGRGRLAFTGELAWAEPPPWSGTPAEWKQALTRAPRWSGALTTDSLALAQVSEFYPQAGGWRGALSTTLTLSGRPAAPIVTAKGRLAKPGWGQGSLDDFDLDLGYESELLTIRRFAMVGADSLGPTVTGTLPIRLGWGVPADERLPDRPMEITAHARGLDLGLVPLVLPQIAAANGKMDVDARLTGTPRAPYAAGTVTVRDGIVRPANREEVMTGVAGTIKLDGSELRIVNFEARQGKRGLLVAAPGGIAHLKNLRIADYQFALEAHNVTAFASGEYVIELDGTFQVRNGEDLGGPLPLPHITGNASVIEGVFLANFADPDRQAAWQGPAVLPPWTYDVQVEARNNVWWRPPDANVEGKLTDFEVIQTLDRFLMLGGVDAIRGRYYFLGNQFDVASGQLFFDATEPMNPTINAALTAEKRLPKEQGGAREVITVTVTGRAQRPTVSMSSDPGNLSQTEIASLLTFGQFQSGAGAAIGQVGVGYLARQLARQVPELEQYLGVVELGTTQDQNNVTTTGGFASKAYYTVGVSRYFTRDLLLRYSQVVGDLTDAQSVDFQDLDAEYRISRLLYLNGQVKRRRGFLVTAQEQSVYYNLEVRARYEY